MNDNFHDQWTYVGRYAPSPSGHLHVGHAQTFWIAQQRALSASDIKGNKKNVKMLLRLEDIDLARCSKPQVAQDMYEDMKWFGIRWDEGPVRYEDVADVTVGAVDICPHISVSTTANSTTSGFNNNEDGCDTKREQQQQQQYVQSKRFSVYKKALQRLAQLGVVYPCTQSRKDVKEALSAPHTDTNHIYQHIKTAAAMAAAVADRDSSSAMPSTSGMMQLHQQQQQLSAVERAMIGSDVIFPPHLRPLYMQFIAGDNDSSSNRNTSATAAACTSSAIDPPRYYRARAIQEYEKLKAMAAAAGRNENDGRAVIPPKKKKRQSNSGGSISSSSNSSAAKIIDESSGNTSTISSSLSTVSGPCAGFANEEENDECIIDTNVNWRFRVPDGELISFEDGCFKLPPYASSSDATCSSPSPFTSSVENCSFNTLNSDSNSNSNSQSIVNLFAGVDFGDFLVWRAADGGSPSYELAVIVDDLLMGVTEIVRAEDLLISTARQLLIMRELVANIADDDNLSIVSPFAAASTGPPPPQTTTTTITTRITTTTTITTRTTTGEKALSAVPVSSSKSHTNCTPVRKISDLVPPFAPSSRKINFFHVPLLCDAEGRRLAKRTDAKSLRQLRAEGYTPQMIRDTFFAKEFNTSITFHYFAMRAAVYIQRE